MCVTFQVSIDPVAIITAAWTAASRPFGYLKDPEPGITNMDGAMDKLRSMKLDIDDKIKLEELAGQLATHQVRDWLAKVSAVDAKVSKIKDDRQNCSANYSVNRRVRKRMADIDALQKESGDLMNVADKRLPPDVQKLNLVERPYNPSKDRYLSDLRAYLQEDGSRIIGIWGMGGIGKTTLMQCLNNELHSSSTSCQTPPEFNHVIWAVASKDYKLENLQRDIAQRLGLPSNENKAEQARVIFDFLKDRSFLLLLDDLWQPLDFVEVGIPHPIHAGNSGPKQKVVFTTRLEGVCGKMQAKHILKLECLNKDEAWQLFQDKVNEETFRAHVRIPQLARQVAEECDGLPLALVVIGAAMSTKKTLKEWQNAITLLEKSRLHEIHGMEEDTIMWKLKFSYDNLADKIKQKCFLLCCLWPEDYSIRKIDLIEYWMGHGLIDERKFDNINEAYDSGHALIGSLLAACLLEPGNHQDNEVMMHDVVRDLAIWISSNCGENPNNFIINSSASAFKDSHCEVEKILLMDDFFRDTFIFPSNCSKLKTLILRGHDSFFKHIPTGFFEGTPSLTYLDLSFTGISELPSEIGLLSNLQHLNLSGTIIASLPLQLGILRVLKFLFLRYMGSIIIPDGLIEKLEMLSVIDMSYTECENWKEILRLQGSLKGVGIRLTTIESLQQLVLLSNLPIWRLDLYNLGGFKGPLQLGSFNNQSCIQTLGINSCMSLKVVSIAPNSQKGSLSRLEELELSSLPKLKNIVFRGVVPEKMMPSLTRLLISTCAKLLNISWAMHLPSLEVLIVSDCLKMKQIIDEDSEGDTVVDDNVLSAGKSSDAFPSLKVISLEELPNLRMFANKMLTFPLLEILTVSECPEMKTLPFGLEVIGKSLKNIYGERKWWDELEMEGDVRAALMPRFLEMQMNRLRSLRPI